MNRSVRRRASVPVLGALGIGALALSASACVVNAGSGGRRAANDPQYVSNMPPSQQGSTPMPPTGPAPPMAPRPNVPQTTPSNPPASPPVVGTRVPNSDPRFKVIAMPNIFGRPQPGALKGNVFFIPDTTSSFPDLTGRSPDAVLYTDTLNIPVRDFDQGFPGVSERSEWFAIRYEGNFTVARPGIYKFRLVSDDGSLAYVDGRKVVDNDGRHVEKEANGSIELTAGTHALRVDYFQALRWTVALQLFVEAPGGRMQPFSPSM